MSNKILTIIVITLMSCGTLNAQLKYIVKAGYTNSVMKWKEGIFNEKFDSKSSFYIGASLEKQWSEKFGLLGGLRFTTLGGKDAYETMFVTDEGLAAGIIEYNYNIPQLSIPIAAKFYPLKKLSLLGGLNFNFILSPTVEVQPGNSINNVSDGDLESLKSFNMNTFLGAEYYFTENIFVEGRYNIGVFDAAKDNAINTYFNYFQLGLGYQF